MLQVIFSCFFLSHSYLRLDSIGTSSGLGQRLVQSIITRNDKVIATARDISKIQDFRKLADETQLYILQLDVTDSIETIQSRIREAISVWGRIDVLVNNAGSSGRMLLEEGRLLSPPTGNMDNRYLQEGNESCSFYTSLSLTWSTIELWGSRKCLMSTYTV